MTTRRELLVATLSSAVASTLAAAAPRATSKDGQDRSPDRDPMAVHRSVVVVNGLDPSALSAEYLRFSEQAGVGVWLRAEHQTLAELAIAHSFYDGHSDRIAVARSVREIRELRGRGKIAQVLGWQSAGQLSDDSNQSVTSGPAIANLRAYYELGLRTCGIAYNLANEFGGGCLEADFGLTRNGRKLVEQIHHLRMVLDVSGHTGERTSLDALAMSAGVPVICSHTNIKALNDNPRCSSDRVLEAIARTGGVIGITAFSDFHTRTTVDAKVLSSPQARLERHLDQYDYLKRLLGIEHVGIGPDFTFGGTKVVPNYPVDGSPGPIERIPEANANGSAQYVSSEAYSIQRPWLYVRGFENISQLPNVTRGLIQRGWSNAELRQLLGENWLRVYQRVWGA